MTIWSKVRSVSSEKIVRVSCILGLIALPLMVWSVWQPTVWPVLVALSIGQGIGTLSFLLYLIAIVRDLGVVRRIRPSEEKPDSVT